MKTGTKEGTMGVPPEQLQKFLENVNYPVKKNDLIEQVRKNRQGQSEKIEEGNPVFSEILRRLDMLPDKEYKSYNDVVSELMRR